MKTLRAALGLAVAAAVAASLAGCATSGGDANFLRVGIAAPIDSLNPFVSDSDYSTVTYQYVYPHLTEYNAEVEIVPSFATSWETSADGLVWTFDTVPDAKWSDGEPLTAEDAAFTLTMMMEHQDGQTGLLAGWVSHMAAAEAPDENTLVVTYDRPVSNVLTQMQGLHILPEHVWAPLAEGDGAKITEFENSAPMVSGGPFALTEYRLNEFAIFEANPHWWGPSMPRIEGFGFQFFANEDAMVQALKSGQVDIIGRTPPTVASGLEEDGFVVEVGEGTGLKQLIINTNPNKAGHRELLDPKVRMAMEYAIDRSAIVDTAWLGFAESGSTLVSSASPWHDASIEPLPFDVAAANALLDGAGYALGPDGVRIADGERMSYEVIFPDSEAGAGDRTFQIMKSGFADIGIEVSQRKMDGGAAWDAVRAPDDEYTQFDLVLWNWTPAIDPDFLLSTLTCDQFGNNSDSGYCNPAYDELYKAQGSAADDEERGRIIDEMQQILFDDRPYIILNYPNMIDAHSPEWTGFVLSPLLGSINNASTETLLNVHRVSP